MPHEYPDINTIEKAVLTSGEDAIAKRNVLSIFDGSIMSQIIQYGIREKHGKSMGIRVILELSPQTGEIYNLYSGDDENKIFEVDRKLVPIKIIFQEPLEKDKIVIGSLENYTAYLAADNDALSTLDNKAMANLQSTLSLFNRMSGAY